MKIQDKIKSSDSERLSNLGYTSWRLYTDINKLTLDKFLDCLLSKEYTSLIISGEPPEDEIIKAWNKIFEDYAKSTGGEQYNTIFVKTKAVNLMLAKIYLIDTICDNLLFAHNDRACEILNSYLLKCDIKFEDDIPTRREKIDMIRSRALRFTTMLDKLQKELQDAQVGAVEGQGGQDYFDDMLNVFSEASGYMIRACDITVSRFLKMGNRLQERQKQLELKSLKNGGSGAYR